MRHVAAEGPVEFHLHFEPIPLVHLGRSKTLVEAGLWRQGLLLLRHGASLHPGRWAQGQHDGGYCYGQEEGCEQQPLQRGSVCAGEKTRRHQPARRGTECRSMRAPRHCATVGANRSVSEAGKLMIAKSRTRKGSRRDRRRSPGERAPQTIRGNLLSESATRLYVAVTIMRQTAKAPDRNRGDLCKRSYRFRTVLGCDCHQWGFESHCPEEYKRTIRDSGTCRRCYGSSTRIRPG